MTLVRKINLSTMVDLFQLGMGQTLQAQIKMMLSLKVASNGSVPSYSFWIHSDFSSILGPVYLLESNFLLESEFQESQFQESILRYLVV
jgi:hypothetical protein